MTSIWQIVLHTCNVAVGVVAAAIVVVRLPRYMNLAIRLVALLRMMLDIVRAEGPRASKGPKRIQMKLGIYN